MADVLYGNEYIEISREERSLYIRSIKPGFSLEMFNDIFSKSFPNVRIISFNAIQKVILNVPSGPELFGEERERIFIEVSDDELKATMSLNVSAPDLLPSNRSPLIKEIIAALSEAGVIYGVNKGIFEGELKAGIKYLIAEGRPAINGNDASVRLYEINVPKPKIIDQGKVDHYELNLINHVKQGDWLGERIDPTPGVPGNSVRGKVLNAISGQNSPLVYDRVSIREECHGGITTLLSMKNGAVYYKGDSIGVYDSLEIKGDVDYSTGNVDFDGYLSIKGTVADSFSVTANKDIEILSEYGMGAVERIHSKEGNVYIKGGIFGKGKSVIVCKKNLYVKYLSDITVECEGSVFVGFYCINANIRAKQVIVESLKGRISGGYIDADICVSAPDIGSRAEQRTLIRVRGFERNVLRADLENITLKLKEKRDDLVQIKRQFEKYSSTKLTPKQSNIYESLKNEFSELRDTIKGLEYQYKNLNEFLKTPGEGAVISKNRFFPKVRIEIKGLVEEITSEEPMGTFAYKDNELIKL